MIEFFKIGLYHYLALAFLLFVIGFFGLIVVKNVLKMFICVEFMLGAVNINLIAFATYMDNINFDGYVMAIFVIALGAVEIAIALAIFYLMFKEKQTVETDCYKELRG